MKNRTCSRTYAFAILAVVMLHAPITMAHQVGGSATFLNDVETERSKTQRHTSRRHKKSHHVKEWRHRGGFDTPSASAVDVLSGQLDDLGLDTPSSVIPDAGIDLGPSMFDMPFDPWVDGPTLSGCDVNAMEELYLQYPHKVGQPDFMRAIARVGCLPPEKTAAPASTTSIDVFDNRPTVYERAEESLEELDETITERSVVRRTRDSANPAPPRTAEAAIVEPEALEETTRIAVLKDTDRDEAERAASKAPSVIAPVATTPACPSPAALNSVANPQAPRQLDTPEVVEPETPEHFKMPPLSEIMGDASEVEVIEPAEPALPEVVEVFDIVEPEVAPLAEVTAQVEPIEDGRRLRKLEREILSQINRIRARHDLPMLRPEARLAKAAVLHSQDMFDNEYFSHIAPRSEGRTFVGRIKAQGLKGFGRAGENLAHGPYRRNLAKRFVKSWMNSPEHRDNILTPGYRFSGIGVYGDRDNIFATQLFSQRIHRAHRVR